MAQCITAVLKGIFKKEDNWRMRLLQDWPAIIGDLGPYVSLASIKDDVLILAVKDACWMHELHMLTPLLLQTINKKLDQHRIKQLRFKQQGVVRTKKAKHKKYDTKKVPTQETPLTYRERKALHTIKDPALAHALQRFLKRCKQEK